VWGGNDNAIPQNSYTQSYLDSRRKILVMTMRNIETPIQEKLSQPEETISKMSSWTTNKMEGCD